MGATAVSKKKSLRDIARSLRRISEEGPSFPPERITPIGLGEDRMEYILSLSTEASMSTREASKLSKFAVCDIAHWNVKLVGEVRRLRKLLENYDGA